MECLLIQIDGSLLWQILADAKPESLQFLDQLLTVLEVETSPLPVQACMAEADWEWLRRQIRAHYEFDLAEEILLRLDLIGFRDPAPTDCLYAILTTSEEWTDRSFAPLKLGIGEFLALYQAICCLEAAYTQSEDGMPKPSLSGQADLGRQRYFASVTTVFSLFSPSERFLGREQALLLGLALVLVLLPHWEALQNGLILPVQAEEGTEASQFAALMQTATQWLSQTVEHWPPVSALAKLNPASEEGSAPSPVSTSPAATPSAIAEDASSPNFSPPNSHPDTPVDPSLTPFPPVIAFPPVAAAIEFSSLIQPLSQVVLQASADPIPPADRLDASLDASNTGDSTPRPTAPSGLAMPNPPAASNLPQPASEPLPPSSPSEERPDGVEPRPNQRPNPPGIADIDVADIGVADVGIADGRPANFEDSPSPASNANLTVAVAPEPTSFPNAWLNQRDSLLGIDLLEAKPWHAREPEGGDTLLVAGSLFLGESAAASVVPLPQQGLIPDDLTAQVLDQTQVLGQTERVQPQLAPPQPSIALDDFSLRSGSRLEVIPTPHSSHDYSGLS